MIQKLQMEISCLDTIYLFLGSAENIIKSYYVFHYSLYNARLYNIFGINGDQNIKLLHT